MPISQNERMPAAKEHKRKNEKITFFFRHIPVTTKNQASKL
jgi:hypothetical protein